MHELQAWAAARSQSEKGDGAKGESDVERWRALLGALLRDEAVLQEGRRRGYDRDPAVRRMMIDRILQKEVEALEKPVDLSNADIERYYLDHSDEFARPEQVRVLQVVTRDRAVAERVAAQARAAERSDLGAFQALATKHSEDWTSRARGGDMGLFDRKSTRVPAAVVKAAFALREPYDVSDLVESDSGFHVLKLVQKLPALTPTLAEIAPEIRARLAHELVERKKGVQAVVLLRRAQVEIDDVALVKASLPKP